MVSRTANLEYAFIFCYCFLRVVFIDALCPEKHHHSSCIHAFPHPQWLPAPHLEKLRARHVRLHHASRQFEAHAHIPGDLEVLTVLPLHRRFRDGRDRSECTDFDGLRALERLEAVRVAVKIINDEKLLGGWTMGADVRDSCSSATVAVKTLREQMYDFCDHLLGNPEMCSYHAVGDELPWVPLRDQREAKEKDVAQLAGEDANDDEDSSGSTMASGDSSHPSAGKTERPKREKLRTKVNTQKTFSSASCPKKPGRSEARPVGVRKVMIGPSSDEVAEALLPITHSYKFVQLSYGMKTRATLPHLFFTTPSLRIQGQAIAALLKELGWHHVAIFASDDAYGNGLLDSVLVFLQRSKAADIPGSVCAALTGTFSADDEEGISAFLSGTKKARLKAIVLLASERHALAFLETAYQRNMSDYMWVGTWKWTTSSEVLQNERLQSVLQRGVLSVAPAPPVDSFVGKNWKWIKQTLLERLRKLVPSPLLISHIPWLKIFWEEHFDCILSRETSMAFQRNLSKPLHRNSYACHIYYDLPETEKIDQAKELCQLDDSLSDEFFLLDEARLIIQTFFIATNALKRRLNKTCNHLLERDENDSLLEPNCYSTQIHKICQVFNNTKKHKIDQDMRQVLYCLLDATLQKSFEELQVVGNDLKQAALALALMNYSSDNTWRDFYQDIGIWKPSEFQFLANRTLALKLLNLTGETSICANEECPPGTEKLYCRTVNTHSCCWSCEDCSGRTVRSANASQCEDCPKGYWPNKDHTTCQKIIPIFYTTRNTVWVSVLVSASVLAGIGVLVSIGLIYKYRYQLADVNTHSYVFLLCQASALFLSVLTCVPPSDGVCTAQLLLLWPWPCALYANWIFSKAGPLAIFQPLAFVPTRFLGKFKENIGTQMLAGSVVVFLLLWTIVSPPNEQTLYKEDESGELKCDLSSKMKTVYYALTLLVFVAMTTVAFWNRRAPSTQNERKYVFISALLMTLLWLFFLPATYVLDKLGPTILLCLICTFQGIVVHICLVSRPIYYIFFEYSDLMSTEDGRTETALEPRHHTLPQIPVMVHLQPETRDTAEDEYDQHEFAIFNRLR